MIRCETAKAATLEQQTIAFVRLDRSSCDLAKDDGMIARRVHSVSVAMEGGQAPVQGWSAVWACIPWIGIKIMALGRKVLGQ